MMQIINRKKDLFMQEKRIRNYRYANNYLSYMIFIYYFCWRKKYT
jgi:hypothetical protein